ncbi:carboxymuconolactone decarboxylase family protein [Yeosuana marina]|uniref:carboxymuconolactone decarboxylase family protein n=1 Tax=Yeosuana marina TaxID=1565536 RepID=UPI0019CFDA97|nr:carboxymuconolactone decarboxylase family protein [Yeosuana marina]
METKKPTTEQILSMMKGAMNGKLPRAIELAGEIFPELVEEHAHSSAFALPQNGALEAETRTLIYLGIALATGSKACIEAMMNKAKMQNISKDKILEAFKIARYAEATRVVGNAEIVFEHLKN